VYWILSPVLTLRGREGVNGFWEGWAGFGSGQAVLGLELGNLIKYF
jgi:hypothetical protein